jgi:hypothetical protein
MEPKQLVYGEADFLRWDPFEGDRDVDIRARTVKIVTTRHTQQCHSADADHVHEIPPGTRARCECAIVDGRWASCYTCTECMIRWQTKCAIPPRERAHG